MLIDRYELAIPSRSLFPHISLHADPSIASFSCILYLRACVIVADADDDIAEVFLLPFLAMVIAATRRLNRPSPTNSIRTSITGSTPVEDENTVRFKIDVT